MSKTANFKAAIVERALELGFDTCRFVAPEAIAPAGAHLETWLDDRHHATMDWMEDTAARRRDPQTLWPDVRSIIMLGMNYGPQDDPLENLAHRSNATISVYARNRDYHDLIKGRLKLLAQWMLSAQARQISGAPDTVANSVKVFVDTAPVMEKPLAAAAGIGWQGKHTNLVSQDFGSWLFLGSIFTTLALEPDEVATDSCGSCRACLDICPTDAFPAPYRLDARRCISYLTIEHKGHIDRTFRQAMGNRIYGCDDCLAICPWNKFARQAREAKLVARDDLRSPELAALLELDDAGFRQMFSGSPVKRIGRDRFFRNVLIAAGNSGDAALLPQIIGKLRDDATIVRAMAVWAAGQIAPLADLQNLRELHAPDELDQDVCMEWQLALESDSGKLIE